MSAAGTTPLKATLAVVFVQHDRVKYAGGLPRLIRALDRLEALETHIVVVDNALAGDWHHRVTDRLAHVGGDNSAWEFSAFDKGIGWLSEQGATFDLYLFATDALLAYGDAFLGLVDDQTFDVALEHQACVGWMDSFMEPCRIHDFVYTTWIRTSLLLMPRAVLPVASPMAYPLDDDEIFGPSPDEPFDSGAPISQNLQDLLRAWLTSNAENQNRLDEVWHSQFTLGDETFTHFKSKAKSILREHLLSARLRQADVPCFDLRALRQVQTDGRGMGALRGAAGHPWQWLHWLDAQLAGPAPPTPLVPPLAAGDAPALLLCLDETDGANAIARFVDHEVLPLVRQRHARARLLLAGNAAPAIRLDDTDGEQPAPTPIADDADPATHGIVGLLVAAGTEDARWHTTGIPRIAVGLAPGPQHHEATLASDDGPLPCWRLADACCRAIDAGHAAARRSA